MNSIEQLNELKLVEPRLKFMELPENINEEIVTSFIDDLKDLPYTVEGEVDLSPIKIGEVFTEAD